MKIYMEFSHFLEMKYLEWQQKQGQRKTIEEFAQFLGVSQAAVSFWMNGKRTPTAESVRLLADIFGPEVYDTLGLERPDPDLAYLERIWDDLPSYAQKALRDQAETYYLRNIKQRVTTADEHDQIDLVDVDEKPTQRDR